MEEHQFDRIARRVAQPVTRREALRALVAASLGGLFLHSSAQGAFAATSSGNSACAHFCTLLCGCDSCACHDACSAAGAHNSGVCFSCGPNGGTSAICSTLTSPGPCACASPGGGYCSNTASDVNNCGACGTTCTSGTSPACCGGTCADLASDVGNCGACGLTCAAGTSPACCSGTCTDVAGDVNNCGACGNVCGTGQTCRNGTCVTPTICVAGTCGNYTHCSSNGSTCFCYTTVEGIAFCGPDVACTSAQTCVSSTDCPAGSACITQNCCSKNICIPACSPGGALRVNSATVPAGPTSAGT